MTRRRTHARYQCELNVTFVHEGREHRGVGDNISLGGMFICTELDLPLAVEVAVRFEVPESGHEIDATAVVRWHKPSGFGVQFHTLRAREVWALNRWFTKLALAEELG